MVGSTWEADNHPHPMKNLHNIVFCVFCAGGFVETVDNNMDNTSASQMDTSLVAVSSLVVLVDEGHMMT
jgi:hypothetical protein